MRPPAQLLVLGRYSSGDLQWMTCKGIVHGRDVFPLVHKDEDTLRFISNMDLNLPAKSKKMKARIQDALGWKLIPTKKENSDEKTEVTVWAGSIMNQAH
jgi:redox-sensitive bicupin YhaK (pirin superfamily)